MTLLPFLLLSVPMAEEPLVAKRTAGTVMPAAGAGLSPYPGHGRIGAPFPAMPDAGFPAMPDAGSGPVDGDSVDMAQMTIEQRVIIRVPMVRSIAPQSSARNVAPPRPVIEWEERKGPRCVQVDQLRAASITTAHGIDLVLRNNKRLRAKLSRECRPEDMYSGFYLQPHSDGAACAGRDRLLARSGANCMITDIKVLVPSN